VLTFPIPLAANLPYLPAILKDHGYHTAAIVGSLAVDPNWGVPGFQRGFDTYDAGFTWQNYSPQTRYQSTQRRGIEVLHHTVGWINKLPPGPFFLWMHLFDAHDPYDPPEPYKTRYAKDLYDGGIAYEDFVVGELIKELKARGLYDGTVIAITADHGESLGAHGEDTHGIFLYDETIHVPLLIKLPKAAVVKRVDERVELADIMPTLLQTAGIDVPKEVQGRTLQDLMKPGPEDESTERFWNERGAYAQADYGHLTFAWSAEESWRTGKYLYIQAPRPELYDETVDAKAEHNLAPASHAVAATLAAKLEDFRQKTTNTQATPKSIMDEARVRKLTALGYVGMSNNPETINSKDRGADPKDKIEIANTIHDITNVLQDWKCEKAEPMLRAAIVKDPEIAMFHFYMGGCFLEKEDYESAVPELRAAVKIEPSFTTAEMNLGRALMTLHRYVEAVPVLEHVEALAPQMMDAHVYLVVAYSYTKQVPEEIRECRAVLKELPEHYGSNLNLGHFLAQSGDLEGGITSLQKAASIRPTDPIPHIYLYEAYTKLGREAEAAHEREEAERLGAVPLGQPDAADKGKSGPQ
jgi:arylsulfatase A-like enzyme/Tfp pilus assembly protein PilF